MNRDRSEATSPFSAALSSDALFQDSFPPDAGSTQADGEAQDSSSAIDYQTATEGELPPEQVAPLAFSANARLNRELRFNLLHTLGYGGGGRVWAAEDRHLGREVAIKELRQEVSRSSRVQDAFLREARITGQLDHPGIVTVYEFGQRVDGSPFVAMKLIRGRTLEDRIQQFHALPTRDPRRVLAFSELIRLMVAICRTIAFAHSRGVMHRDIKPANVMIGDFDEAIVVDWGIAKLIDPVPLAEDQSRGADPSTRRVELDSMADPYQAPGHIVGTLSYMPPEQAGAEPSIDHRADVYALGATLYHILVGKPPLYGLRSSVAMRKILLGEVPPPSAVNRRVSKPLDAICRKAMARDTEARYASAYELGQELARYLAGEPVTAYREPWTRRTARWVRRHQTACWVASAIVAAVLLTTTLWAWSEHTRLAAVEREAQESLTLARAALSEHDYPVARAAASRAESQAHVEPSLAVLHDEAHALLDVLDGLDRFAKLQDETLYRSAVLTELSSTEDRRDALTAATAALELASALDANPRVPSRDRQSLREAAAEIAWLEARIVSQPQSGESRDERVARAKEGLAILRGNPWLPGDSLARVTLEAELARQAGEDALADRLATRAEDWDAKSAFDLMVRGELQRLRGEPAEALADFETALARRPGDVGLLYRQGLARLALQQWDAAVATFSACLDRRPDTVWVLALRGYARGEAGDLDAALADFEAALKLDASHGVVYVTRGYTLLQRGRFTEAEADLRHALDGRQDMIGARHLLAQTLVAQNRLDEAISVMQAGRDRFADAPSLKYALACLLLARRDTAAAKTELEDVLAESATGSAAWIDSQFLLSLLAFQSDDLRSARVRLLDVLTHRQQHPEALWLLGWVQNRSGDQTAAIDTWNRCLAALNRQAHAAHDPWRAVAARSLDALPAATQDQRLFRAMVHRDRGLLLAVQGQQARAAEDYALAARLVPEGEALNSEEERRRFATMFLARGRAALNPASHQAQADFDRVLELAGDRGAALAGRAYAKLFAGDRAGALADADAALAAGPRSVDLLYNVACVHAQALRELDPQSEAAQQHREMFESLIREAMNALPEAARAGFVQQVDRDPALDLVRQDVFWQQIRNTYLTARQ
jgi:tetratricopeptide (TPR) repeat protein/tRNA A-37 threonylcarbamoyl transferase component Bud32